MKKLMFVMVALAVNATAFAADVSVGKAVLGSGTPVNSIGIENAKIVDNANVETGILHAPQYMPNYPTAATIWPRVISVPCTETSAGNLSCDSYNWSPSMGRGEYLFVTPTVVKTTPPAVPIVVTVPGPVREVYIEVPVKKPQE